MFEQIQMKMLFNLSRLFHFRKYEFFNFDFRTMRKRNVSYARGRRHGLLKRPLVFILFFYLYNNFQNNFRFHIVIYSKRELKENAEINFFGHSKCGWLSICR